MTLQPEQHRPRFGNALLAASVITIALTLHVEGQSSSTSHKLQTSLTGGSGAASSTNYNLTGCLDLGLAGTSSSASHSLRVGCGALLASLGADDDDGDGVSNEIEDGAPNGGDGNDDGIADSTQPDVTSIFGGAGWATASVTGCESINGLTTVTESSLGFDAGYDYPLDLVDFEISCSTPGSTATVELLFHDANPAGWPPDAFRNFGPIAPDFGGGETFYTLPGVVFSLTTIGSDDVPTATLQITDGGLGDDSSADGTISAIGGPAALVVAAIPSLTPEALAALMLLLAFAGAWVVRRI